MEDTQSTAMERTTGREGNQEDNQMVLLSSKPLHRFIQKEPKCLGIAILIFGCAEFLMGFHLNVAEYTSGKIYIPFWQGLLFLVSGSLSIYSGIHPSKKMVTVCLAMYVVSILGIVVSVGYRIYCFSWIPYYRYGYRFRKEPYRSSCVSLLFGLDAIMLTLSLCVSVLLIFLSTVARLALKSTHSQVIVRHTREPVNDTT